MIKLYVFVQNSPFQRMSGFVSVYTGHLYLLVTIFFEEMCDTFNLTNLIKSETCYIKNHKSLIDLFLTNKPLSFQKTHVTETGLHDYRKLISTFF